MNEEIEDFETNIVKERRMRVAEMLLTKRYRDERTRYSLSREDDEWDERCLDARARGQSFREWECRETKALANRRGTK